MRSILFVRYFIDILSVHNIFALWTLFFYCDFPKEIVRNLFYWKHPLIFVLFFWFIMDYISTSFEGVACEWLWIIKLTLHRIGCENDSSVVMLCEYYIDRTLVSYNVCTFIYAKVCSGYILNTIENIVWNTYNIR